MNAVIEANITAPRADAMLHVLRLHAGAHEHGGRSADRLLTFTVCALIEDYQPEDIPVVFLEALEEALDLVRRSREYRLAQIQLTHDFAPSPRRRRDCVHLADLAGQAEDEARTIIRHKITLEGNDL